MTTDSMEAEYKRIVFCGICHENLGVERPNYMADHLKQYPDHLTSYDKLIQTD